MNPLTWLRRIRKFERLVHGGVQQIPNSIYDSNTRTSGETLSIREPISPAVSSTGNARTVPMSTIRFDLATGKILNETRH